MFSLALLFLIPRALGDGSRPGSRQSQTVEVAKCPFSDQQAKMHTLFVKLGFCSSASVACCPKLTSLVSGYVV